MDFDLDSPDVDRDASQHDAHELREQKTRLRKIAEDKEKVVRLIELRSWWFFANEEKELLASAHITIGEPLPTSSSPIRSLPDEILLEIFASLPNWNRLHSSAEDGWRARLPGATPMLVCSHWRRLALSCPSLWSHIDCVISSWDGSCRLPVDPQGTDRLTELLSLVLSRSNNHPLDIQLFVDWERDDPHPALPVICGSCWRWRSARVKDYLTDLTILVPSPLPCHLPFLEEAYLGLDQEKLQQLVPSAPNLKYAAFLPLCWGLPSPPSWSGQALSHITCVDLVTYAWQEILAVLPCVEVVVFNLDELAHEYDASRPFLLPSSVRSLTLDRVVDRRFLVDLLTCLKAPSIKHFRLTVVGHITSPGFEDPMALPIEELQEFLSRSGCHLSCFSLENVSIERQVIDGLLEVLPIQSIEVDYKFGGSGGVASLVVHEGTRNLQ